MKRKLFVWQDDETKKYGVIIEKPYTSILPYIYDAILLHDVENKDAMPFATVVKDGQCMQIDNKGNRLKTLVYSTADDSYIGFVANIAEGMAAYQIDECGCTYSKHLPIRNKSNGLFGLINIDGSLIVPFLYQDMEAPSDVSVAVKKETGFDKYAIYNYEKGLVTDFDYHYVRDAENGFRVVDKSYETCIHSGLIDETDGSIKIPFDTYSIVSPSAF